MINSCILFFIFLLTAINPVVSNPKLFSHPINFRTSVININHNADAILGKWMTVENSLEVEVYKQENKYHAKIIWFKIEDTTRPMNTRMDKKNPNPALRTRKWLGMEVLR
ncbi:MAG: DUF2147 domain-containing protein, partial [Ginsengibacter sp.]